MSRIYQSLRENISKLKLIFKLFYALLFQLLDKNKLEKIISLMK